MGAFLSYSIVSGLLMLAMYLVYKMVLSGENQHGYNRSVLLTIYLVAFSTLPIISLLSRPGTSNVPQISIDGATEIVAAATETSAPVWGTVLIWVFIAGMAVVAIKTMVTWVKLIGVIRSGEKLEENDYTYVVTDNDRFAPFSWVRYIVISRNDFTSNLPAIAAHEKQHIASRHWIDLLIAQLVCMVNWFNPAAWLMREELMLVHEYEADKAVIEKGHNPRDYQMLLIKKTVGARFPSLANSLNHSKLKKRITMMHKSKGGAGQKLKALALVPTLTLALGVASIPAVRAAISTISSSEVSIGKGSEKLSEKRKEAKSFTVKSLNNNDNVTTVKIKGENLGNSITVSGATFTTNGKTYTDQAINSSLSGDGEAEITIQFPFLTEFDNTSMTVTINGEKIPFNLENFFNNAKPMTVQVRPVNQDDKTASIPEDAEFYLDGKKISYEEMMSIPSNSIESMSVDKSGNISTVKLKSKKLLTSYYGTATLHEDEVAKAKDNEVVAYGTYRKPDSDDSAAKPIIIMDSEHEIPLADAEIYLDGKRISHEEINKIPSDKIESVSVDKSGSIIIQTKK